VWLVFWTRACGPPSPETEGFCGIKFNRFQKATWKVAMQVQRKGGPKHPVLNVIGVLGVTSCSTDATPLHSGIAYACYQRQAGRQLSWLVWSHALPSQLSHQPTTCKLGVACLTQHKTLVPAEGLPIWRYHASGHAGTSLQFSSIIKIFMSIGPCCNKD
jgi:hypothetical protein